MRALAPGPHKAFQERDAARLPARVAAVVGDRPIRPAANELPAQADRAETPRLIRRRRRRRAAENLARIRSLVLDPMTSTYGS